MGDIGLLLAGLCLAALVLGMGLAIGIMRWRMYRRWRMYKRGKPQGY
jgi:hypothetical protein